MAIATSPHLRISPEQLLNRYSAIAQNPKQWEGTLAGEDDVLNYQAYKDFSSIFGRAPTVDEFSDLLPQYRGETGMDTGRSYVTSLKKQYETSPEYLGTKAPDYYDEVTGVFQELMKRGATDAELQHFGKMLASGQTDVYELNQFMQQMPEYQTAQDKAFREGLAKETEGYDLDLFRKAKDTTMADYKRRGIQNSSALDFALTNVMGDIAKERGRWLSDLSASQYGSNKGAAREDYLTSMNKYLGDIDYERQRRNAYRDSLTGRANAAQDYAIQQRDYLNYLNSQKQEPSKWAQTMDRISTVMNPISNFAMMGGKSGFNWWGD